MRRNWLSGTREARAVIATFTLMITASIAAGAIPESLQDIVLAAGQREVVEVQLDGGTFHGLAPFSRTPYLLWPSAPVSVAHEREAAAAWLRRAAIPLGHLGFEARFSEVGAWHGHEVWRYQLVRSGIAWHDARVELHWDGGRLIGLVNAIAQPILAIEDPAPTTDSSATAFVAVRQGAGYALRLAALEHLDDGVRRTTTLAVDGRVMRRLVATGETRAPRAATIDEWAVPAGNFPDQIDIDSSGTVWFSQTNDHWLTSLDPQLGLFTQHPTTGGTRPDGLVIGSGDIAWTGLYGLPGGISRLGRREIATGSFTAITPPYAPANLAIPNETLAGTIWITDHRQNRVSEYDPGTATWLQSLVLPTPNSWPTAGVEDPVSGDVYFTEYNSSRLARKPLIGPIVEIDAPPASGPAFLVHSNGRIYYTEWLQDRLAAYEIATGVTTEYQFPVAGELAGPIDGVPGGLIAVGTRNVGYIMVFNPATETFAAHQIPTASPGLKDGLRSAVGGAIWFTESGSNKIAVLRLGGTPPVADFSGAPLSGVAPLSVTFSDLSANAPTGWSWSFGDGGSAIGSSPTHVYATPGTYPVTLTVSSDYGYDTEVKPAYVTVFPPCPVSSGELALSAQRQALDVVLTWPPHPDCAWEVHRVTDPLLMPGSPPIASTTSPSYVDPAPPEPLVCYDVVPTDR